jgi:hypothetical protein
LLGRLELVEDIAHFGVFVEQLFAFFVGQEELHDDEDKEAVLDDELVLLVIILGLLFRAVEDFFSVLLLEVFLEQKEDPREVVGQNR